MTEPLSPHSPLNGFAHQSNLAPPGRSLSTFGKGKLEKTSLTTLELRRQIAERVDVLKNITDVANGKMPESWVKNLAQTLKDSGLLDEPEGEEDEGQESKWEKIIRRYMLLTPTQILDANYALLKRILPELKQVDVTESSPEGQITPEDAAAVITERINRAVAIAIEEGKRKKEKEEAERAAASAR